MDRTGMSVMAVDAGSSNGRSKSYTDDMRRLLVELAQVMSMEEILKATSLKRRTVKRLLSTYRRTGELREAPNGQKGHPSVINESISMVHWPPSPSVCTDNTL